MKRKLNKIANELEASMKAIQENPNYTAEKKTIERIIATWKMIIQKHLMETSDGYFINVLYAFQNAVNVHLYELDRKRAFKFVYEVIETIREVANV